MGASQSKIIFSSLVTRLGEGLIEEHDSAFWDEFWKTTLSAEEIFLLFPVDTVREIVLHKRQNIQTLFTQAVAQLYQVVETPYPVYFDQALNCSRVLGRVVPILLENEDKSIRDLFWSRQIATMKPESNEADVLSGNELQDSEPLAVILINALFHLLFLPEFTIPDPSMDFNEADMNSPKFRSALMWAPGVGTAEKATTLSSQYDMNRIEILRLMVACFSDSLYQSPDKYDSCSSMWLEVATSADTPYAEIAFYSLLNVVLGYDPVGWGVPYSATVTTDTAKPLMEVAVQVLIILLDYGLPIVAREAYQMKGGKSRTKSMASSGLPFVYSDDTEAQGFNIFRKMLSSIEDEGHLNFMFSGFSRLLNNVHRSRNTVLPYAQISIDIEEELMVLLWKSLEENPHFIPFIMRSCDVTELVVPICFFMLDGRKDPAKLGLIYLSTFTLLKLSGDRNFGVALNKSYSLRLPVDMPLFTGTFGDLLVISLHKMIVNGSDKLASLYNCFMTVICNISPYCKYLSSISAVKLINLLQLFTSPRFFYANEGNYLYVMMLLTTMNNMVQYQYEGNVHLVYAILRRKEIFYRLARLTLPRAIRDIKQLQKQDFYKSFNGGTSSVATGVSGTKRGAEGSDSEVLSKMALVSAPTDLISTTLERREFLDSMKRNKFRSEEIILAAEGSTALHDTDASNSAAEPPASSIQGRQIDNLDPKVVRMSETSSSIVDRTGSFISELEDEPMEESATTGVHGVASLNKSSGVGETSDFGEDSEFESDEEFGNIEVMSLAGNEANKHNEKDAISELEDKFNRHKKTQNMLNEPEPNSLTADNLILRNERKAKFASDKLKSQNSAAGLKDRFVPDQEWLEKVRKALPLATIMRMLKNLLPLVKDMGIEKSEAALDEKQVVLFLQRTTLVGLLPVPHPIVIRKYQPNKYTSLWFSAFLWGVIFTHNQELALFDGKGVRLFIVQTQAS